MVSVPAPRPGIYAGLAGSPMAFEERAMQT